MYDFDRGSLHNITHLTGESKLALGLVLSDKKRAIRLLYAIP